MSCAETLWELSSPWRSDENAETVWSDTGAGRVRQPGAQAWQSARQHKRCMQYQIHE